MKREIPVEVAGQMLKIRSDEDVRYVKSLGKFVDEKISEVRRDRQGVTTLNIALTAAITIADELHKIRRTQEGIDGELDRLSSAIESSLEDSG